MPRSLIALGGLVVSVVAIVVVVATVDVGRTASVLARTNPLPLVAVLMVVAVQLLVRSYRWRWILPRSADGRPIPTRRLVPPLLVGYLGNAVLPARLGEPMRAVLVSRRERVGVAEALASVLLERIVDVASLALVALVAAAVVGAPAWIVQAAGFAALVGMGAVAVLATVGMAPILALVRRVPAVGRKPRLAEAFSHLDRFAHTLGGGHRRRVIGFAFVLSLVAWLLDATTFWLAGQAVGAELGYAGAALISGIAVLGTAVPSAPGYVGTFELAGAAVASALGVPAEHGLALALVVHVLTLLPLAAGGAISLAAMGTGLAEVARASEGAGADAVEG
jgi:uncharacterized protein (TIRG00374 family)